MKDRNFIPKTVSRKELHFTFLKEEFYDREKKYLAQMISEGCSFAQD
jgi:hypothetical protein